MMRLWQGAVGEVPTGGLVSPAYVVAKPNPTASGKYYEYLFRMSKYKLEVEMRSRGIVPDRNRLYWDQFKQIPLLLPPKCEQDKIVDHIAQQTEVLSTRARREIELIREYRTRLIADVVTGKLDVRQHPDAAEDVALDDDLDISADEELFETLDDDGAVPDEEEEVAAE
jgi:type I restriction enzyme S subunit